MLRALALLLALALPAFAQEEVVLGLSQNKVSITTNFDGSEILIFGAVKRESAIPEGEPLGVIVTIQGPSEPLTVRRKEKRFGIWINTEAVEVDAAPSFYAIAASDKLDELISSTEDLRYKISIPQAIRSVGAPMSVADAQSFSEAVIRIRKANNLFQLLENSVELSEETLFRTSIAMPANLTEGAYKTRIYLTRNSQVVSEYETVIDVQKVGLERWLFTLSRQQPLLYGLLSLAIAIISGWGASAIFTGLRRN
ncbi:MAG: TIGR02186 family protein [Planktotalea sp.]|uniref:TIGR02186 family protein n=1 Tax=Planktotalea sp. TaxID=2029877 RepID=UPI003C76F6DA